jgi:hypothetical protein
MSDLTAKDKTYLEKLFQMGGGYVLDFSDRTMGEFFADTLGVDIYADEYNYASGSKANRIRGFWRAAEDGLVGRSIDALVDYIVMKVTVGDLKLEDYPAVLMEEARAIGQRLTGTQSDVRQEARVAAFLEEDFTNIGAAIASLDAGAKDVIQQRVDEVSKILSIAPLAAIFLMGSTLEGILLEVARRDAKSFTAANAAQKYKGAVTPLDEWRLAALIDVAYELSYLSRNVRDFSHSLKTFRNYIHPREQAKAQFNPNADTAKICFQVLKAAITEVDAASAKQGGEVA